MREKINKLAQGSIDDCTPIVIVEPESIEYEVVPDVPVKMELTVTTGNDVYVKGLAYSSDMRVSILNPAFGGSNTRLIFEALLKSGDTDDAVCGHIDLVTNGGEIKVPFIFHRKDAELNQELYCLDTIRDFARLAEENKNEALRLFSSPNFINSPFMKQIRFRTIYRLFSKCPDRETSLDQFIAACGIRIANYSEESLKFSSCQTGTCPVSADEKIHIKRTRVTFRRHYYEYSRLRLAFEMDRSNKIGLINEMTDHLEALYGYGHRQEFIQLLKAEAACLKGDIPSALMLMNSAAAAVRDNRTDMASEYFLLEYLEIIVNHRDKASFIRLCRKFIEERQMTELFIYVIKLDDELVNNDIHLRDFLTDVYNLGSRSPWLYYYYCVLLNDHQEFLYAPRNIDSQSLIFGKKYHVIEDSLSQAVAAAACTAYIKSDRRMISAHRTYAEGIRLGLNINGLYEYYLYTLPKDADYVIDDKVIDHYRMGDRLDTDTKARLYACVVRSKKKTTAAYRSYEDRINRFALEQLGQRNISNHLIDIYVNVLRPEMIDKETAGAFLSLVYCCRIATGNPSVKSIVITYPEADTESVAAAESGTAIAPVFDESGIILFQDAYGNRFYDVPYKKEVLFVQNAFRNAAEKIARFNPVVRRKRVTELITKKTLNGDDVQLLENEIQEKGLNFESKCLIVNRLIQYYNQHAATGYNPEFLLKINKMNLSSSERQDLCSAYITCGCYKQAYEMIADYGYCGISDRNLKTLCSGMILRKLCDDDALFIRLCENTVKNDLTDNVILSYLCEHYNGPTESMYKVLSKSISAHVDTYDMEERLLAQLIFIGNTDRLDRVFGWYVSRKKVSESIVKAYFTLKSTAYFINNAPVSSEVFEYIEDSVRSHDNFDTVPDLFILALAKYYSGLENLSKTRIALASKMTAYMLHKKYVFDFIRKFERYFSLPAEFRNCRAVSYPAGSGKTVYFRSCITPTENFFMRETADCVFMNIHIKYKVLFAGERWDYEVYETDGSDTILTCKDSLDFDGEESQCSGTRYDRLNSICILLAAGKDSDALAMMRDYSQTENAVKRLFSI